MAKPSDFQIPDDVIKLANDRIVIEFRQRDEVFADVVGKIREDVGRRNVLYSTITTQKIRAAVEAEYTLRAFRAFEIWHEAYSAQGLAFTDLEHREVAAQVRAQLATLCDELVRSWKWAHALMDGSLPTHLKVGDLDHGRENAVEDASSKLAFRVAVSAPTRVGQLGQTIDRWFRRQASLYPWLSSRISWFIGMIVALMVAFVFGKIT